MRTSAALFAVMVLGTLAPSALAGRDRGLDLAVLFSDDLRPCQGGVPLAGPGIACDGAPVCKKFPRGASPDELIAVAKDISPEWAATLEAARAKDSAAFEAVAAKGSRRLASLAVLKARKPELYALRIEEIRVQGELNDLSQHWASATLGGRTAEAESLETRIRGLAGTLVDLNLRSRAMELAEIDAVMRAMRKDLERDTRGRDDSINLVVDACRNGDEPPVLGGRAPISSGQEIPRDPSVEPAKVPTIGAATSVATPAANPK